MQAEKQQQPWKVSIQARAHNFNFKLKATKILPTGNFHRFSLLLRLHNFILKLRLKSGSTVSISAQQKTTLKSTFLGLLGKLRLRRVKNPDVKSVLNRVKQFANKKSICAGSLVIAILALLLQSISKKDRKGIITHTCIILMCWILYFNIDVRGKRSRFWMVLIVGTAGSWVALNLGKNYVSDYGWNWMKWSYDYAASSGCWYAACQLIFALFKFFFPHLSKKLKENLF